MKRTSDLFLFVTCLIIVAGFYLWAFLFACLAAWQWRFYRLTMLKKLTVSPHIHDAFQATNVWAKRHGFHYIGMFGNGIAVFAVWENSERAAFLTLDLNRREPAYRFSTFFDESITLESGNWREMLWFPYPPGHFVQVFKDSGLHPLWERHLEAESWLTHDENVTLTPYRPEFPWGNVPAESAGKKTLWSAPQVAFPQLVRTQARYFLRSWTIPFTLPFTMVYRNFFWSDKSVRQLAESGKIVAPSNLPSDYKKYAATWPPTKSVQKGEIQTNTIPSYCDENLVRPKKGNFFTMHILPVLVAVMIVGMLCGLMFYELYVPSPTEETIALQKDFRQHLFELDETAALETADRIRQSYYRDESYAHTAWQQAETQQFDACRKTMTKITGRFRRHHSPSIRSILRRHLALALAASDRFDEVDAALGDAWRSSDITARICRYYLAADQTDRALAFLEKSHKNDEYCQTLREIVAKYTRQGEFEKAFDIARKIEADGWRNASLREIVRESLIRNEYENARKASESFDLLRYRQQTAALFMIWHLERNEVDAAWTIYEQNLVDAAEDKRIIEQNDERPSHRHDDWKRLNAIRQKLPYSRSDWGQITSEVFIQCGHAKEARRIHGFVPSPSNDTKTPIEAVLVPTREDLLRQLEIDFTGIENYYVSEEFLQQLQSVLSHCQAGNENAAVEALAHCWDVPLPQLFYPQYNLETRTKIMMFLFGMEIFLERFTEAEKMIARIGVTNTLDNVVVRVRLAKALLAAQRFDEAQEHAKEALTFARRIDAAIGPTWVQNVSEMIAVPILLDELQFHAEAEEMRNRFAPPPRLRLLRFHGNTQFSFK